MTRRGRWLVVALLLTPFWPAAAQRVARPLTDPVLRPGDVLRITVWRHPELTGEFTIGPDSVLVHPVYQVVKVGGAPLGVARERLRGLLTTYERDVQLVIEPLFPVTVAGEVRQPNLYRLAEGTTVAQAIALAGGPTERGRLEKVRLIRRDGETAMNLVRNYARYETLPVASGDQVLVARRSGFNVLRDVVLPVASLTAAVAAVISARRSRP
jgi:protein involved in polysaccharide export with SLBB domain